MTAWAAIVTVGLIFDGGLAVASESAAPLPSPPADSKNSKPLLPDHPRAKAFQERFNALAREHAEKFAAAEKAGQAAKTDEELDRVQKLWPNTAEFAERFLALVDEEPSAPGAPDALYWAFQCVAHEAISPDATEEQYAEHHRELMLAGEILRRLRRHITDPRMANYCQQVGISAQPEAIPLLRAVLNENPDRTAKGHACQALAEALSLLSENADFISTNPEEAKLLEKEWGKAAVDSLRGQDVVALDREAEALHERVLAEFGDIKLYPEFPKDTRMLAKISDDWLANRRELAIGNPAPEIEGTDPDGKPLKLSDFRGKVVVLVFWGSWCAPCMAEVPHERELAKRMMGQPFTLLGVNTDRTPEAARKVIAEQGISWPNWYDGSPESGSIVERYHVRLFPTALIIDGKGIIRTKNVRGGELEKEVEALLKEQEAKN